jgi:D-3-phosphoglycerate dehydrogenase / 2-oxoglutarate reductase
LNRKKVVILNLGYADFEIEKRMLADIGVDVHIVENDCTTEDQVITAAHEADGVLIREAPFTRKVVSALSNCRIISRYGVGVDHIDLEAAAERKIYVTNVPDYCTEEVSDHAIALILACLRKLTLRDRLIREGVFETDINDSIYRSSGKTLGLVGYGKIAQAVHRKWNGFLPREVLVFDPYLKGGLISRNNARPVDLNVLLAESDIISLHAPLAPETKHIISKETLELLKTHAIIVNTSRGGLIDESALVEALKSGKLMAAGLDVFENEPIDETHPLCSLDNVVLSGHVAWYSRDSISTLQKEATKEVIRVFSGEPPKNWVNRWD